MTATATIEGPIAEKRVPGEVGVWVFIFGDMVLFAYVFLVYLQYRGSDAEVFRNSSDVLNQHLGVVYTLVLLLSSLFVVIALHNVRPGGRRDVAARCYAAAIGCGLIFAAMKGLEYYTEVSHDNTPSTNRFFTFYFLLTGLHLLHLVLGLVVLAWLVRLCARPESTRGQMIALEGGSCYWHMVDFLWMVIFPLLYLIR